jgi:hypothetical protein
MSTERQNAQNAKDFAAALLQEVEEGAGTLETLQEERGLAAWERKWDTTIASYVIEGFNMAIAQLQRRQLTWT